MTSLEMASTSRTGCSRRRSSVARTTSTSSAKSEPCTSCTFFPGRIVLAFDAQGRERHRPHQLEGEARRERRGAEVEALELPGEQCRRRAAVLGVRRPRATGELGRHREVAVDLEHVAPGSVTAGQRTREPGGAPRPSNVVNRSRRTHVEASAFPVSSSCWRRPSPPPSRSAWAPAPRARPPRSRTITVVGTGEVRGTPDVADLVLGVSGPRRLRRRGDARIADRAQKVIDALHDAGVSDDDIQTADLSVQPVFDDDGNVTGYEASNTVSVRIRDLGKAGAIVDAAAAKAGDDIRVQGITLLDRRRQRAAGRRAHQGHQARPRPGRAAGERRRRGGRRGAFDHRVDQQRSPLPTPATRPRRPPAPR